MPAAKRILAFDLGAESGRAIVGHFDGDRLALEVVHRFDNGGVRVGDRLYWDVLRLFTEMQNGMRRAGDRFNGIDSVGIDTWGVDFALLGRDGELLGNPRHYRDPHTESILEETFRRVPREYIFQQTGIQFMRINTLFQLLALQRDRSPLLSAATDLLMIPDLFHYWLTGEMASEVTDASTSQFYDPVARDWAVDLFDRLGLPRRILGRLIPPGTTLGPLLPTVASETRLPQIPVVVPATHDTASAVAAVPATGEAWCYLSSGTWSLMGIETERPIIDERVLAHNFTNETGVDGTIRFLKNIMGLWLVQECRRAWKSEGHDYSYDDLTHLAAEAIPFGSVIDPDHDDFLLPDHMPRAIQQFCKRTGQPVPQGVGSVVRCALESLALRYRWVLERLEELHGHHIERIHIVGGGSQNRLLNQLTADACNRPVHAGPVEATAVGNVLVQALGLGLISSVDQGRDLVRRSFPVDTFDPQPDDRWETAYERFRSLTKA